jgi:hypothetical protein
LLFESGPCIHISLYAGLVRDIQQIRSEIIVRNGASIPVNVIGTVSLFIVLKDRSIENVMLKDYLYIPSLIKSLFSWSKLKSLNQHYLKDRKNILVHNIINDEVILWLKECHILTY